MKEIHSIAKILAVLSIIQAAMCVLKKEIAPDVTKFFGERINSNRTKVTWAHAVNDKAKLEEALKNDNIMMIEADVVIGNLTDASGNQTENVPILAHPPTATSDLSLEEFLQSVITDGKHGIKLDFKTIEAFNGARPTLEKHRGNMTFPVWLNADVVLGPVNATAEDQLPVDPSSFVAGAAAVLPESTLSIGWTTRYGSEFNITTGSYTQDHIRKMIDVVRTAAEKQPITYPVRAGLAANDIDVFTALLKNTSVHAPTLTIWSAGNDAVDAAALSTFIKKIGVDKVYVDVPEALRAKLDISGVPSMAASSMMLVGSLVTSFVFAKLI